MKHLRICQFLCLLGWWMVVQSPWVYAQHDADFPDASGDAIEVFARNGDWDGVSKLAGAILKQDPDDLEGRYWRGIASREKEKGYSILANATADLEFVVKRDSLFQDVLFQYALTLAYRQQYPTDLTESLRLAERQLQLKPALDEAQFGIFGLYREFTRARTASAALTWLRRHASPHARYFEGEVLRQEGRLVEADGIFANLMMPYVTGGMQELPVQPVLLSRARVYYQMDRPERAQPFLVEAIRTVDDDLSARFVFEDFKHVLTPEEFREYNELITPEDHQSFFGKLWIKRDPAPASSVNLRLAEHYRRLMYAERHYVFTGFRAKFNAPVDPARDEGFAPSDFPATHSLVSEFDDRGIIYIRHGEPAESEVYVGINWDAESWQYNEPEMDFHFSTSENGMGVGNYHLRPTPHRTLLEKIAGWDGLYVALAKDWDRTEFIVVREGREHLERGLTTDRPTLQGEITPVALPFVMAFFRGPGDGTLVSLYYAYPLGEIARSAPGEDTVAVDVGFALHDLEWIPVATVGEVRRLAAEGADRSAAAVDVFHRLVEPDSYHVAIHMRSLSTNHLGASRFNERVPNFAGTILRMSSLVPAYFVGPAAHGSRYNRGDLVVRSNPLRSYSRDEPVYLYFEVYRLTFGSDDLTHYAVEYRLRSKEEPGRLFSLFGNRKDEIVLAVKTEGSGSTTTLVEYPAIDVSRVEPGDYRLEVTVTDENTGASAEQSIDISLTK